MMRGKWTLGLILVLAAASVVAWSQKTPIQAWWWVHQLSRANAEQREACLPHLQPLGEAVIPSLLAGLRTPEETVCGNMEAGWQSITHDWPLDDSRTHAAVEMLHAQFASYSIEGKASALRLIASMVGPQHATGSLPGGLGRLVGELLEAGNQADETRPAALALAGALVERMPVGQGAATCRGLALRGLADPSAKTRVAAIQLVLRDPLRKDNELLAKMLPLLRDREPTVRRFAVIALGTHRDIASEEHLLPLLHDDDLETQHLSEVALRSRGLSEEHLRLGRLISDSNPSVRLQVLPLLRQTTDLDPHVWLRRLTQDAAPAVRAAAVRAASVEPSADFRDRLEEMARTDPSATVRDIAKYYVEHSNIRKAGD